MSRAAWTLAGAAVLSQVAYPLVAGPGRAPLTVMSVGLFFLASVTHAVASCGARWAAAFVAVAAGTGLAVEAVGVRSGLPFGDYSYAGSLGPKVLGVPWVVPLAWAMMAYPALVAGRRLGGSDRWLVALLGGWVLASWDVFLDPQMVAAGHWSWAHPTPALPEVPGVPLTNYAGWLVTAVVLIALLHRLPRAPRAPARRADDRVPALLLLWTYASQLLANIAFFHRPGVAMAGGLLMGAVVVPYAVSLSRGRSGREVAA